MALAYGGCECASRTRPFFVLFSFFFHGPSATPHRQGPQQVGAVGRQGNLRKVCGALARSGTYGKHMLSRSPGADIEDEERRHFKENVFPKARRLPLPIRLGVLTSLPWTIERRRLHTNGGNSEQKCYRLRFPRLPAKQSAHPEGRKQERRKKKPDNFIRLAWRRCIIVCYTTCTCGCAASGVSAAWMY